MEYSRLHIGAADFLLPKSSEFVATDALGNANRNLTEFNACREFTGESVLSFDIPPATGAAPALEAPAIRIPGGLKIEAELQTPIDSDHSARGDLIKAVIGKDVRSGRKIVAPKGAILTGRITRFEKRATAKQDYLLVGLDFSAIESGAGRGEFRAAPHLAPKPRAESTTGGVLAVRGSRVFLPPGYSTVWLTVP